MTRRKRYLCTEDAPWTPDKGNYTSHPDAKAVGEQEDGWPGGDIQRYECPHCGLRFSRELPQ
jgi:hypothetical protein